MAKSDNLRRAKEEKNDEFYTRLEDIEAEISSHEDYVKQFKGKTVLCNCDDPEWSNFFEFFRLHFNQLKLKKLITTHYNKDGSPSYKLEWSGEKLHGDTVNMIKTPLKGNGDFRSEECIELLKKADIVVTNPPFSLFIQYVNQLVEYKKKFIIIGSLSAVSYKEVFPLIKEGKMFSGYQPRIPLFRVPENANQNNITTIDGIKYAKMGNCGWYTNFKLDKQNDEVPLTKNYKGNENRYPKYVNFDAIDCNKIEDIPKDYYGIIGVPVTFIYQHNIRQFELVGIGTGKMAASVGVKKNYRGRTDLAIKENGVDKCPYNRILIRRIKHDE